MFMVFLEVVFEMAMSQVALFDIYTDIAFTALVNKEGMKTLAALSCICVVLISLPKLYSLVLSLVLMFNCTKSSREEDTRRKWTHRLLVLNESRL